jgi:hypothetical protein
MKQETINGLSIGHVKQIIRRSMITKKKEDANIYNRKKIKKYGKTDED